MTTVADVGDERTLMLPSQSGKRIGLRSALAGLILQVAVILAFLAAVLIADSLPSHMARQMERVGPYLVMALLLGFCAAGGGLWAWMLARIVGLAERKRMAWAGALVYASATLVAIFLLNEAEQYFVEGPGRYLLSVHVVFAIVFTLAAAGVAALAGLVLGIALRDGRLGLWLALFAGLAAGSAFLLADVVQDLLGRRVGGINAAATLTMLTVMLVGNIIASLAASGVIGVMLARWRVERSALACVGSL
jgi:hypothetical protein